jgi:hypothetical protein
MIITGGPTPDMIAAGSLSTSSAALVCSAGVAWAASPHFVSSSATPSGVNLVVSFKEAGGTNQNIDYQASAEATATFASTKAEQTPRRRTRRLCQDRCLQLERSPSGKNGQVTASLTLNPPGPGTFSCPSGQGRQIAQVVYTKVEIADTTNGVTEKIPGTFDTGLAAKRQRGC